MKFFAMAFSESDGSPSSMRLVTLLIVLAIMGCWVAVTLHKWQLQELSPEQAGIVLGALGVKAWQRGKEASNTATTDNQKTG